MTEDRIPKERQREWPSLGFVADNHRQGADNARQYAKETKHVPRNTDDRDFDEYE